MTSTKSERAIIIDFDDVCKEAHQTLSSSHGSFTRSTLLEDTLSLPNKALVRIKHNRILRDLFRKETQAHKSVIATAGTSSPLQKGSQQPVLPPSC